VPDLGISPFLIGAVVVAAVIALAVLAWRLECKRREALAATARKLGLTFCPDRDPGLAQRFEDLRGLNEGEDRYAFDIFTGTYGQHQVTLFDFHYETSSTDSKGRRSTTTHYLHVVVLHLGRLFPRLMVTPEGIFSKIAQAFGYDDIDFESHEFSSRYCVRSPDKKFAYDFCNATMIELLLERPGTALEISSDVLAFVRDGRMDPERIGPELEFACEARERMPAYLFSA
jgi:hypothetical protein